MQDDLWAKGAYSEFFERRRKLLARAMNEFLTKLGATGDDAQRRVGIDALLKEAESQRLEFKSTLRWDLDKGYTNKDLEEVALKTVTGFLNAEGEDLVLGVSDEHEVVGLKHDFESSNCIADRDGFERHLNAVIRMAIGDATMAFLTATFHSVDGEEICQVSIEPSDHPVCVSGANGQAFFLRQGNATRSLDPKETLMYATTHWKEH